MPSFMYVGDPRKEESAKRYSDQPFVMFEGLRFTMEQPTHVAEGNTRLIEKLRGNSHFEEVKADVEAVAEEIEPEADERDVLIEEGERLGVKLNKRMSADTMRERIAEAMNGTDAN